MRTPTQVNMFDTGQAARVLGFESFGLAYLLKRFCGVKANKEYQLADWRWDSFLSLPQNPPADGQHAQVRARGHALPPLHQRRAARAAPARQRPAQPPGGRPRPQRGALPAGLPEARLLAGGRGGAAAQVRLLSHPQPESLSRSTPRSAACFWRSATGATASPATPTSPRSSCCPSPPS